MAAEIPPPRVPMVNPANGQVERAWHRYMMGNNDDVVAVTGTSASNSASIVTLNSDVSTIASSITTINGDIGTINATLSGLPSVYAPIAGTMYIGTTATTLNRASGPQTLAGLTLTAPNIGDATGLSVALTGAITSSGGGIGYAAGAGGTVTQQTSRSTGITLNKLCGDITMFSAAVGAETSSSFVLTNSFIAATDLVVVQHTSATNGGAWCISAVPASGSCTIIVRNATNASITEATPLRFAVIKGATT